MKCWVLTKRLEQQITTADMKVIRKIQGVTRWDSKRNEDLYKQSNMLHIVQVINKNNLRWFGHVTRREEYSTLRVVDEWKETERKTKTKVARQHRSPPESKEHITERSPPNELSRE